MGFPLLEPQVQTPPPAPELLLRVGSESLLCPSPAAPTHSWGLESPCSLQWGAEQTPASRSRAPRQCAHRTWKRRLPLLYLVWPGVGTSLWSQDQGPLRIKVLGRPPRGSRRPWQPGAPPPLGGASDGCPNWVKMGRGLRQLYSLANWWGRTSDKR